MVQGSFVYLLCQPVSYSPLNDRLWIANIGRVGFGYDQNGFHALSPRCSLWERKFPYENRHHAVSYGRSPVPNNRPDPTRRCMKSGLLFDDMGVGEARARLYRQRGLPRFTF